MFFLKNKKKRHNWIYLWLIIFLISLLILSPQIISGRMIVGDDCWFHMNRAYEDMMQIKTGHFSGFINLFSFNSSGRIVNNLYGPLGGYLEGLILLVIKTWYRWELFNSLLVLVIAGGSMAYVSRKLGASFWLSALTGVFYLISFPFNRWVINQNFDGFGAMLIPWFLLAGYRIFKHDFSPVKLALLVTVTSQIHLMSTAIGITSLLISFILANCYPGRLMVWLKAVKATGLCLLLTINVWGSLLEIKGSNYLVPTFPYHGFLSIHNVIYGSVVNQPIINHVAVELIIFLIFGLVWIGLQHANSITKFCVIQGLFFFWLTTQYFPWAFLLKHYSMLASYLQFPERFLPVTIASLLLLFNQVRPRAMIIILLLGMVIVNAGFNVQNERNTINLQYTKLMKSSQNVILKKPVSFHYVEDSLHSDNDATFIKLTENRVPDYMPIKTPINQSSQYYQLRPDVQDLNDVINNRLKVHHHIMNRNTEELTFNARPGHEIQLPFVKYNHTKLWLNHQLIQPNLNLIHAIKIRPSQRHNTLIAQYQPSSWYSISIWIELLTWLILIIKLTVFRQLN